MVLRREIFTFIDVLVGVALYLTISSTSTERTEFLTKVGIQPTVDERIVADRRHCQPMASEEES